MTAYVYQVKRLEGATLGWGIYRVLTPGVNRLVALAESQELAEQIAGMLSGSGSG